MRRFLLTELPLAALAYAALAVLVTWPVATDVGSTVLGPIDGDAAGGIWWLDAAQEHGYRLWGTAVFDDIAYPYGLARGNALNIQTLLPYLPAFLATKVIGAVAAFNLTILVGFALSGCAMYALARRLGASPLVAGWAGLVFVLFPWHVERAVAGHGSLVHLACFPLLALALIQVGEKRTPARLALVGGAVLACWLTSAFYGVMALVLVPAVAVAAALVTRPRRDALATATWLTAIAVAVSGGVFLASLAGGKDSGYGATREAEDLRTYGLRPIELVVPAPASDLMKRIDPLFHESRRHGSNIQEVSNYLGWVTIGFAAVWLVVARRRRATLTPTLRNVTVASLVGALVSVALALPSPVTLFGVTWTWMPSRLLWEIVPAFRVPSRWTVALLFCLLILATLGLQALVERLRAQGGARGRGLALATVSVVVVASVVELRISHPGVHFSATDVPPEYALVARAPAGALAEYPLVSSENSTNSEWALWQRSHGRPLVNGAASGTAAEDVRRSLVDPRGPGVAGRLAALGATVVVTRPNTLSRALEEEIPDEAPLLGDGFERIGDAGDATVWRVTASPAAAIASLAAPGFATPTYADGRVVQELGGSDATIVLEARAPVRGTLHTFAVSRDGAVHRISIAGTSASVDPGGRELIVPVDIPRGRSELRVMVAGAPSNGARVALTAPYVER